MASLSPQELSALSGESVLLEKVQAALRAAQARRRHVLTPSAHELRQLRDDAIAASEDDSPTLLHELSVRQQLRHRSPGALPDARSPYLAHLRIAEAGRGPRDYLLGHETFIDAEAGVWVVDWRVAPVAQLFYRYREGDSFEESLPGRELSGVVELRRVVVIHEGRLVQVIGDGLALSRHGEEWLSADRAALHLRPGGSGTAARPGQLGLGIGAVSREERTEVTALLDAEQFAAISSPPEQPLLVLGSAGSGKTTVALHRLARLTALEPSRFPLSKTRVVVPEEGLARLSRRLLAPLGSAQALVQTLDVASAALAKEVFGKVPKLAPEVPALVTSLKRHPAFHAALMAEVTPKGPTSLKRLRRALAALLSDRTFLSRVVAAARGELPSTVVEETVRHTMLQLAPTTRALLATITDETMKEALDGLPLDEGTPDELAGTIDVEDLPLLLAMHARRKPLVVEEAAHLVLDEAEDFAVAELEALGALIVKSRSVTLAGDEAQQTFSSFGGWPRTMEALKVKEALTCRLSVSYRCPAPVAELAHRILGPLARGGLPRSARGGAPVGRFNFPVESQAHLFLAGALRDLLEQEPHASVAVICHDRTTARRFEQVAASLGGRLVLDGEFTFEPGLDVTDLDSVKGLEFDYVVVPDATAAVYPESDEARRRLHVAVTRTSHQLWLVSPGTPSPLIGEPG